MDDEVNTFAWIPRAFRPARASALFVFINGNDRYVEGAGIAAVNVPIGTNMWQCKQVEFTD
jgi:hypothetical protein